MYASPEADKAVEHLENLISYMANESLPPWFVQATRSSELLAVIKAIGKAQEEDDHRPVACPNTLEKVENKAMLID